MAAKPTGRRRKERCVMATDAEWARIREAAEAAGLSISDYIVCSSATGQMSASLTDASLSRSVLRRTVRAVLVLEGLEKRRLENQGGTEIWCSLLGDADAWIDTESTLE